MRIAAALIGGLGAALGTVKGFLFVLATLLLGLRGTGFNPAGLQGSGGFNPFLFLWMGTEGGIAISCVLGMVGAGFAVAGRP